LDDLGDVPACAQAKPSDYRPVGKKKNPEGKIPPGSGWKLKEYD
jgi:hypothetical protein